MRSRLVALGRPKIFLKIHAGELDLAQLHIVHDVQDLLRQSGVPAARLVLAGTEFGNGKFASVHAFRDRGDRLRAYHRGSIEGAATAIARLIEIGRSFHALASVPDLFSGRKNPLAARAPGIPEPPPLPSSDRATAVAARVKEDGRAISGNKVISHGDWASRNMRFYKGEVSSIFDFEALRCGVEPLLVGQAAIQFINEPRGVRDPASAAVHFIKAYEAAARRIFEGEDAVALDTGIALAVARFCRAAVRSDGMRDEDAPRIFSSFMARFRTAFGRSYPYKEWTD